MIKNEGELQKGGFMVLPINQPTARRLKRLSVGDAVTVTKGKNTDAIRDGPRSHDCKLC